MSVEQMYVRIQDSGMSQCTMYIHNSDIFMVQSSSPFVPHLGLRRILQT